MSRRVSIGIAIVMVAVGKTFGATPKPIIPRARGPVLVGWSCATTGATSLALLKPDIVRALARVDAAERQGDRAFEIDLDGRDGPEALVPLTCSATGNCTWAVFSVRPARFRGVVLGAGLYVRRQARGWAEITGYTHMSACEGELVTYRFVRGRYRAVGSGLNIQRYSDLYNVPTYFRNPGLACDVEENPSARCGPLLK